MAEPTVTCPNCRTEIHLTEPLAAPLIAFSTMQEDLDKELSAIMKQWAKREQQIERVIGTTVGMYDDLQGIAGKFLREIEWLELHALTNNG